MHDVTNHYMVVAAGRVSPSSWGSECVTVSLPKVDHAHCFFASRDRSAAAWRRQSGPAINGEDDVGRDAGAGGATTKARPQWGPTGFDGASRAKEVEKVAAQTTKTPTEVVTDFYTAFARKDGKAMTAAYAPNARFSDKVFPQLDRTKAGAMWRMLTKSGDLKIRHEILKVDGDTVTAKWIANYPAPGTGRPVENYARSGARVVHTHALVRVGEAHHHLDDGARRVELAALLAGGVGEVGDQIFV